MHLTFLLVGLLLPTAAEPISQPDQPARIELVAGGETAAGEPSAREPHITSPFGVDFDAAGSLYFVEMLGNRVRRLGLDGRIQTLAGTGRLGHVGDDGPAVTAELNGPHSLVVADNDDIYIADTWNNRVRKIDSKSGA